MSTTLISGGTVLTCDEQHTIYTPGDIVLADDRIAFVGPAFGGQADSTVDARGRIVLPGLINAHTHAAMTIFRSVADDVDLMVFLQQCVWPREVKLTGDDVYAGAMLAGVEMLKSGITTFVDMYFYQEYVTRAVLDLGMRAMITAPLLESPAWVPLIGHWDDQLKRAVDFCRRWEGHAGRIHTGLGPHAPYTLPLEALREIGIAAREIGRPINIHLLETKQERDSFDAQGMGTEIEALRDIGFFEGPVIGAHSVWLREPDIDIYAAHGVSAVHCPQSNCKLGSGIAPIESMLRKGVRVALGTDGAATNDNLDLWEEMRLAPLLAKVHALDPKPVTARQALAMATRAGAEAIFMPELGVLATGRRADVLMIDAEDTTAVPVFAPETYVSNVVNAMGRESV
jgi:5-methylthioadenosine/S-adenosylhomocysteine deaminase